MNPEEVSQLLWILQAFFVGVAVLVGLLALPMYYEKIPPNRWYGVRTARTRADADLWYRVNKAGGKYLLYASGFIIVMNVLFLGRFWFHPEHEVWVFVMLGCQLLLGDGALIAAAVLPLFQINE